MRKSTNGHTIQYAYDELNRLTAITYPDASTVTFTYDANGNRTQMVGPAVGAGSAGPLLVGSLPSAQSDGLLGAATYQYDALNRMTQDSDSFGKVVGYGYDAAGNRTTLTYPGGDVVTYAYDDANRMTGVTDWLNRTTSYGYDAAGRLVMTTNPNGTTATYAYDAAGRLIGLTNAKSDATVISSYAYTLDEIGNQVQADQNEPLQPVFATQQTPYSYDAENRMTMVGGTATTFDHNGNMTAKGADSFAYDFENRLTQSTIGGVTSQYRYNGLGNRLAKTVAGTTARYVLDVNRPMTNILAETDGTGTVTASYVYGLGLIARIAPDGSELIYHYDSRGSAIGLTDASGNVTDAYSYDPFGVPLAHTGNTVNPFTYVGRYGVMDEGNGLTYVRARYYTPDTGRFLTKDPQTGSERDGQSLHRYIYALNNPIILADVTGFYSFGALLSDAEALLLDIGKATTKAAAGAVLKGTYWAVINGYTTAPGISGAIEGRLVRTTGGINILGVIGSSVIYFAGNKILDVAQGPRQHIPGLSLIPFGIGDAADLILSYQRAGGDLDCAGRDAGSDYCMQRQMALNKNLPFIPETQVPQAAPAAQKRH